MNIKNLNIHEDKRSKCLSIMVTVTVIDYLELIEDAYSNPNRGNLDFQREPLKTKSAIQIRKRMVEDIALGTVLPPMVIGLIVKDYEIDTLKTVETGDFIAFIKKIPKENISLIDGMQRTTAIKEARESIDISQNYLRVEFWVASKINNLIYRMLILNTGQVPWNLRRQIEVIYSSLIKQIEEKVTDLSILKVDDKGRRSQGAQFQAHDIIELFIVFGARKETVDTKERLADEFARLDIIEAAKTDDLTEKFIIILNLLGQIDTQFCRFDQIPPQMDNKFTSGKDLFSSQPAKVGFLTAIAKKVYGRPGNDFSIEKQQSSYSEIKSGIDSLILKLQSMSPTDLEEFLSFSTLNERILRQSSKVGLFEREYFTKAFEALIEEHFGVSSLHTCWVAY